MNPGTRIADSKGRLGSPHAAAILLLPGFLTALGCSNEPAAPAVKPAAEHKAVGARAASIPQDPEKQKEKRRLRREWHYNTSVAAFEKVGNHDPKWDQDAREAVRRYYAYTSVPWYMQDSDDRVAMVQAAKRAVAKGCDDPFILYIRVRMRYEPEEATADSLDLFKKAADGLQESRYPAIRVLHALNNLAVEILEKSNQENEARSKEEALERLDAAIRLIPKLMEEESAEGIQEFLFLTQNLETNLKRVLGDRMAAVERLLEPLKGIEKARPLYLLVRGASCIHHAWDARGTGVAATVTPEQFQLMRERLLLARKDLLEAYEASPPFASQIAAAMITVHLGLDGDRASMEQWFERAMRADGDCGAACSAKLNFLEPKWYGTPEEARRFGEECLATKNLEGGLPIVFEAALYERSIYNARPKDYFKRPEVWGQARSVYEMYMKEFPKVKALPVRLARWAFLCGQFEEAKRLLEDVGDTGWLGVFSSHREYEEFRGQIETALAKENRLKKR